MPASARARRRVVPPLIAAAAPALLLAPLLDPRRLLAVRDVPFFHLPLRQAMVALARAGELPEWNRWIHSGQPILSDPNYAAFYPPTWLALVVSVSYSLQLLALLHAAIALAGAWRLARRLGCAPAVAAMAAMAFAGSGWLLSLLGTFNFFCAMAWFPWALAGAFAAIEVETEAWSGSAIGAAAALALQLLAGEPVTVLVTALAMLALALAPGSARRGALPRLLAIGVLAAALGAVQLVPTLHRLTGGARAAGLSDVAADRWSMPPARAVDALLPRFWGDPARDEEGLWLGWGVHDDGFPYVVSLYSGLLPSLLALVGIFALSIPHRWAFASAMAAGVLLALGRHDPLWELLRRHVPVFNVVRYPEKFIVLTTALVPFAGALAWQRLVEARATNDTRERGPHRVVLALFVGFTLVVVVLALLTFGATDLVAGFVRAHSGMPPSPARLASVLRYLRREALVALALAVVATALVWAVLRGRLAPARATLLALVLLGLDLIWYGRGLAATLPRATFLTAPRALPAVRAAGGRAASSDGLDRRPEVGLRQGPAGFQQLWARAQRLDPEIGTLWRVEYALERDYDLMLTPWGRHALDLLHDAWPERAAVDRLLGAWDVGSLVLRRDADELARELRATGRLPRPFVVVPIASRLPRFRFVSRVDRVDDAALARERLGEIDLAREDVCVGAEAPTPSTYAPATVLAWRDPQRIEVGYTAAARAFLVAAVTFDDGWSARLEDGRAIALCPTALGQIGAVLPGGTHTLHLRYRDPWVRVGVATTLVTIMAIALIGLRRRREPIQSAA